MGKHPDTMAEAFCQAYAQMLDAKKAYIHVFSNVAGDFFDANGGVGRRHENMMRRKGVKPRINELLSQRSMASESRVRHEFEAIAFAKITDVVTWETKELLDDEGVPVVDDAGNQQMVSHLQLIDSDELSPKVSASIKSIKQTKYGLAIEMHDKLAALNKLALTHPALQGNKTGGDGDDDVPVLTLFNSENGDIQAALEDLQNREDLAAATQDDEEDE